MYNGIGLQTARGSGTNGHVQRNWAFVRPGKKTNTNYKTEEELEKLNAISSKQPNLEILDHERKRKIEVKCAELEDVLESQGLSEAEIKEKVKAFRENLVNRVVTENPINSKTGRIEVRETHQIAQAQQEKNARLREAFGISEYFVEGSSFDAERKAKEDLAKSEAIQKELQEKNCLELKESGKKYALIRTPSEERDTDDKSETDVKKHKSSKRKKKKSSSNTDRKKKSKKHKKEKSKKKSKKSRHDFESSNNSITSDSGSSSENESELKRTNKKSKKTKKSKSKKKDTKKGKLTESCESSVKSDYENYTHKNDRVSEKDKIHGQIIERGEDSTNKRSSENIRKGQQEKIQKSRENDNNTIEEYPKRKRTTSPKIKLKDNSTKVWDESKFRSDRRNTKESSRNHEKKKTTSPKSNYRREDDYSKSGNKRSRSREERDKKYCRSRSPKKISSATTSRLNETRDRKNNSRERSKRSDSRNRRHSPKRLDDKKRTTSSSKSRYTKKYNSSVRNHSRSPITRHSHRRSRSISIDKRKRCRSTDGRSKLRSTPKRTRTPTEDKTVTVRNSTNKKISSSKQEDSYKKDLTTNPRKRSLSKSSSFSPTKRIAHAIDYSSPKSKKPNISHSRSLSYSPAKRNPERYRDILEKTNQRSRKRTSPSPSKRKRSTSKSYTKPKPIVKLHPSDDKSSVDSEQDEAGNLYDEIPSGAVKTSSELLKLKAQLAAKAKKTLEEKKTVEKSTFLPTPIEIIIEKPSTIKSSPIERDYKEEGREKKYRVREDSVEGNKNKIAIKPFKIHDVIDKIGVSDVFDREILSNNDQQQLTLASLRDLDKMKPPKCPSPSMEKSHFVKERSPTADTTETNRSSRSTSRHSKTSRDYSSRSRRSHSTRSRSSASSRSSSRSSSSSSSSSRSSSSSSHHSSRRSRSRSPSIPRRSGSPSFLDRRRITRSPHSRRYSRSRSSRSYSRDHNRRSARYRR